MNPRHFRRLLVFVAGLTIWASLPSLVVLPQPSLRTSAVQTRIFQEGADGYTGLADTWISANDWADPPQHTVNYGLNPTLTLSRDGDDNPLLRYDLTVIPGNSAILTATLSLYNTSQSSVSGTRTFMRRVQAFATIGPWGEGNQIESSIDAPGKHGATGDFAYDNYPGEGPDVPWGGRGMVAGMDYVAAPIASANVGDPGWVDWDVTDFIQAWVRGENFQSGLVLRDATGYEDDHNDQRVFVSGQGANQALRPKLTVTFNPDVPFALAGHDQWDLNWQGGQITLDASASHNRPGGNDADLMYTWSIEQAGFGSSLSGDLAPASPSPTLNFTADVPGEWVIRLTVTNELGESATDTMNVRLLQIPTGHPRIHLTPEKLSQLRIYFAGGSSRFSQLMNEADRPEGSMMAQALVFQVTGDLISCQRAIGAALIQIFDPGDWPTKAGDLAIIYDWCHAQLSPAQRTTFVTYFNAWGDDIPKCEDVPGWGNYWPRFGYSYAMIGLATYGDNDRAIQWLNEYRYNRFRDSDQAMLDRIAPGGGWPEGMIYDWIANYPRIKAVEAWTSATGENLFLSTRWFQERLGYLLLHRWPGTADQWGYDYHPYVSTGDTERNRGSMANYERIMGLMLIEQFPTDLRAQRLQSYLAAPPTDNSMSFLYHEEFLWFDPQSPALDPNGQNTHVALGTGTVFMRSGWPSGPADTDPSATYLTFQSGDHFSYHQHFDQNSFTLFKYGDLAVDSGVYSGDGLSYHDQNYYVRTIAHNTLVVHNPTEDFSTARPDAVSNDGGQRTMSPGSRAPQAADGWDLYATQYDTGDMLHNSDTSDYTYVLGDATKAYNNPDYYQALDTAFSANLPKVSRFQRELAYLRPANQSVGEYVVLFDRVGVTQASFSGANTKLLLHTLNQPTVSGTGTVVSPGETLFTGADRATATSGDGRLTVDVLLPADANLRVVGGQAQKSFWVFGENFDWHWADNEAQPRPINDFEETPYGEWRLEIEPGDTALYHNFLTIMQPAHVSAAPMPAATVIQATDGMAGVHIADAGQNRVTLFSTAQDGAAPTGAVTYAYTPTTTLSLNLLFDLIPYQRYAVTTTLQNGVRHVTVRADNGAFYAANPQGVLRFYPENNIPSVFTYLPTAMRGYLPAAVTPTRTPTATPTGQSATSTPTSTRTPTPTPTTPTSNPQGHIVYSLDNDMVYRINAGAGATPENISTALNALSAGGNDGQLNVSPNGQWLLLRTERFHADCVGWDCLALVRGDLSAGEAVLTPNGVIHAEGGGAVNNDGTLIVYPGGDGPHDQDLFAVRRTGGTWSAPALLTEASTYAFHTMPALSADGSKVLMDCSPTSYPSRAICEVGTDGTGFRTVLDQTDSPPGLPDVGALHHPDYATDGSIVFEGDWDGEMIWRLPAGGSVPERVNVAYTNDNSPCVLADGRIVSLWLNRPDGSGDHELKVMNADGSAGAVILPGVDVFDVGLGCGE